MSDTGMYTVTHVCVVLAIVAPIISYIDDSDNYHIIIGVLRGGGQGGLAPPPPPKIG